MRVLFLSPVVPWPPRAGGRIRTLELLRALGRTGAGEVHLRAALDPASTPRATAEAQEALRAACASVAVFPRSGVSAIERVRLPKLARWFHSAPLLECARRELAQGEFDLVHVDEMFLAGALPALLPAASPVPVVVHHHKLDLEFARATGSSTYDALKLKRLERFVARSFEHHVLCSTEDATRLSQRHPGLTCSVVANGVDPSFFRPRDTPREPRTLLFLGSLDYAPNLDAIEHLATDVLPELRRARADVRVDVVGARPHPALGWLEGAGVRLVGEVDDVRPHLARAAALVVPLRIGGGSRLKIAEALAMGCPVVSTGVGVEGLELRDGEHVRIAGPGARFAQATLEVLDDPRSAAERTARGRAVILERYTWSRLAGRLHEAWEAALAPASASSA